jgi:hypothetical protein
MKELREKYKQQAKDYDQEITEHGFRNYLRNNNLHTARPLSETELIEHNRYNNKIGGMGLSMLTPVATLGAIAGIAYLNKIVLEGAMGNAPIGGSNVMRDYFGNPIQGNDLNPEASNHLLYEMGYRGEAHADRPHDHNMNFPNVPTTSYSSLMEEEEELINRNDPKYYL